jgi:hypothetical protein
MLKSRRAFFTGNPSKTTREFIEDSLRNSLWDEIQADGESVIVGLKPKRLSEILGSKGEGKATA